MRFFAGMPHRYRLQNVLAVAVAVFLMTPRVDAATWDISPNTQIQFSVGHLRLLEVEGEFSNAVRGEVRIDEQDISKSSVKVFIDAAKIQTGIARRDEHLKRASFLDVAQYPTISFTSKEVTRIGPEQFRVTGDLVIRGVTREVTLAVEGSLLAAAKDSSGTKKLHGLATTTINRHDFGLHWKIGGVLEATVSNEVAVTIDVELVKKGSIPTVVSQVGH